MLLPLADEVDVIEPVAKFTQELQGKQGVRNVYNVGLQDWRPVDGITYDLVWTQWCVGHLTDAQLVEYFQRCQAALRPGGLIVLKENLSTMGADVFDELDSSVTRLVPLSYFARCLFMAWFTVVIMTNVVELYREDTKFRKIFEDAGLHLVKTELQRGFPETAQMKLLPVRMYALKPKAEGS